MNQSSRLVVDQASLIGKLARHLRHMSLPGTSRQLPEALLQDIGDHWRARRVSFIPAWDPSGSPARSWTAASLSSHPPRTAPGLPKAWLGGGAPEEPLRLAATDLAALRWDLGADEAIVLPLACQGECAGFLLAERFGPASMLPELPQPHLQAVANLVGGMLQLAYLSQQSSDHLARQRILDATPGLHTWYWEAQDLRFGSRGRGDSQALRFSDKDVFGLVAPSCHSELRQALEEAIRSGKPLSRTLPGAVSGTADSGSDTWVQLFGMRQYDGILGTAADVTAQQQQWEEVERTRQRFERLGEEAPAIVYMLKVTGNGDLLPSYAADTVSEQWGYRPSEVLERSWWESHLHPEDVGAAVAARKRLLHEGSLSIEYRIRDSQNRYRWVRDHASALTGRDGSIVEVLGFWMDVSEQYEAESRVRRSETRYRALLDDAPAMICRYSRDFTILYVNQPCAEHFGTHPGEMVGANWLDFVPAEERDSFRAQIYALQPDNPVVSMEIRKVVGRADVRHQFWTNRAFFAGDDSLYEVQSVGTDNTKLKIAQEQLAHAGKMATLGVIITGVAHELYQPLNIIRLAVKNAMGPLLAGKATPELLQSKLDKVEEQVRRAVTIIDHMRIFGRKSKERPEVFDPFQSTRQALSFMDEQLAMAGIVAELTRDDSVGLIKGFPDQLEQVIMNLIINARDAIRQRRDQDGDFSGVIQVHVGQPDDAQVAISVKDNGAGIEEEILDRIFDPFFTTKEVGQGTGLGLPLAFGIVRDMNGTIYAENHENGGAQFVIRVPVVASLSDAAAVQATRPEW